MSRFRARRDASGPADRGVEYRPVHNQNTLSAIKASAVTALLVARSDGDESALEQLMPLVEAKLRRLPRKYIKRERCQCLLQPSLLANGGVLGSIAWRPAKLWLLRELSGDRS